MDNQSEVLFFRPKHIELLNEVSQRLLPLYYILSVAQLCSSPSDTAALSTMMERVKVVQVPPLIPLRRVPAKVRGDYGQT